MSCPRCQTAWKCPCESCLKHRRPSDTSQTWRYTDPDNRQCLTCGFNAHLDYWLSWADGVDQDEVNNIAERCPDWRSWPWCDYETQAAHGDYPAGTKCKAVRDWRNNLILLRFDSGLVELSGDTWRLDHEKHGPLIENIYAEEDERAFLALSGFLPVPGTPSLERGAQARPDPESSTPRA